ncbi:hypothetical protein HDU81_010883 [Chytriomyces hyalinus]|nr:hypothetical protein HDU81_010883 [Chytriomyces hyalinus]
MCSVQAQRPLSQVLVPGILVSEETTRLLKSPTLWMHAFKSSNPAHTTNDSYTNKHLKRDLADCIETLAIGSPPTSPLAAKTAKPVARKKKMSRYCTGLAEHESIAEAVRYIMDGANDAGRNDGKATSHSPDRRPLANPKSFKKGRFIVTPIIK